MTDQRREVVVDATELEKFRTLARWVINSAGHGINDSMRNQGANLLAFIDNTTKQAALPNAEEGDFDCPKAHASRSCPCGFCKALRS